MAPAVSRLRFGQYVLSGILTIIPIWVSWLIFEFVWRQLSQLGMPWLRLIAEGLGAEAPGLADFLTQPWVDEAVAAIFTIFALYLVGWAATRVLGRRLIADFDHLILRVPLLGFVYGAVQKMVKLLRDKPEKGVQRVVLIEFPHRDLKAVGLVVRTIKDVVTGGEIAAVYVPTAPNPTSGYLELVPIERLVHTEWTVDEAMNFVMTMGAVSPPHVHFTSSRPD